MDLSRYLKRRRGPTVLFLGAGAGIADGLPSTASMVASINTALDRLGDDSRFSGMERLDVFRTRGDLESFLDLLDEAGSLRQTSPLHTALYRRLAWATACAAHLPYVGVEGYRKLLIRHYLNRDCETFVLTTNWDTSLDTIIQHLGGGLWIDYGIERIRLNIPISLTRLHLYKINGSPNWLLCRNCGLLVVEDFPEDISARGLPDTQFSSDPTCDICHDCLERVLVMPARRKAYHPLAGPEWLSDSKASVEALNMVSLHSQASRALMAAQDFVFVGYSLPLYDHEIRDLIQLSLGKNSFVQEGRASFVIVTGGPDADSTKDRYAEVLEGKPCAFYSSGLEAFVLMLSA
jgi:hypothetical protein